jgi:hypothetical protein
MTNLELFFAILGTLTAMMTAQGILLKFYMDAKIDPIKGDVKLYIDAKIDPIKDQVDLLVQYMISHEGKIAALEAKKN